MIGSTIAHYRITGKLGEGGMGEVYRAADDRLNRDVAIKILPESVEQDPARLTRFRREAQVLAALTHGNIAQVYGLEEEDGRFAIVLELVEGETLAERIARGPVSIEDAREIALQIAEGLEAAHEKGIVHRDLKPANIKIAPDGTVKLLDFGLAKALAGETPEQDLANSPTMTAAATQAGIILGTAAYMAPEQAKGKPVDRRADVWAFGCVLYEMLTGRAPFEGDGVSELLAHVITRDPDLDALPRDLSPRVGDTIRRCLRKDPRMRLPDIAAARIALIEADQPMAPTATNEAGVSRAPRFSRGLVAAFVLGGIGLGLALGFLWPRAVSQAPASTEARQSPMAGIVALPEAAQIAYGAAPIGYDSPMLTLSADGRNLVFVGRDGDGSRLYRHDLSTFGPPEPIPGTEGALEAFFSPFEDSVAFYTNDKLARVDLNGDRLQTLGDVRSATRLIWADDRRIYVGDSQARQLVRFPEDGGDGEFLGELPAHGLSDVLAGGEAVLLHEKTTTLRCDFGVVKLYDIAAGESRVVLNNAYDARVTGDRLYFVRDSALLSVGFDTTSGEPIGEPEILVRDVAVDSIFGQAQFAMSPSGTLVYLPGGDRSVGTIAWVDRNGDRGTLPVEPRVYGTLDLDPTDQRIAVHVGDVSDYIWIYDLNRQAGRRLPSTASAGWPNWNSAGDSVSYTASGETYQLMQQPVDARATPRLIRELSRATAASWSPDDRYVAMTVEGIEVFEVGGGLAAEPIPGFMADFSPDGRWITYGTEQGGVYETIVGSWPDGDQVYSIQTDGGIESSWSLDGQLFYRLGNRWYVVENRSGETFEWTQPKLAFEIAFLDTPGRSYAVTSDGQRLYTIVQAEPDVVDRIHVVSGVLARTP